MKRSVKTILSLAVVGIGLVLTPLISGPTGSLQAETLSISQIDASSLLLSQEVDLYISVTDERGRSAEGLTRENFQVFESADGTEYKPVPEIKNLAEKPNKEQGIHIMLLIDNSGSMYDTLSGTPTEEPSKMRITHAKQAIRRFINRSFNPRDVISLASFNTTVSLHSEALKDPSALEGLLDSIERPEKEQAYTELYHALEDSSLELAGYRGRKVVVVLSDGENYPYLVHAGKPHPEYGRETLIPEEVVRSYQMEGITLYAIHFGIDRDLHLSDIARETGGNVYDARNEEELASVYLDIKEKIENEYRLTYRATMIPTERKYVKVEYERGAQRSSSERYYYAGTIFGIPLSPYPFLILLLTAAAVLIWIVLLLIRYRKQRTSATLEVLQPGYRTTVSSMTIPLTQDKTVIGGGERADLTISGLSSVKPEHATIVHDEKSGDFTLASEGNITVNNRAVRGNRKLKDGDVVNIEGTTIVFDAAPGTEKSEKS
jgi:Ca-activated chloride channel family protein